MVIKSPTSFYNTAHYHVLKRYNFSCYVSKLGYIRACVYMQPLKCGNSDIFACHIENRAYAFLAGVWLQRTVSPLCLNNLGKFELILPVASDEASMSTSSNNVAIFMISVRYDGLFRSLNGWVTNLFLYLNCCDEKHSKLIRKQCVVAITASRGAF